MSKLEIFYPISAHGGYNVSICSTDKDGEQCKIGISINDFYLIIIPKNEKAKEEFENWYVKDYSAEKGKLPEKLAKLEKLTVDKDKFDFIDNQKQAYKEFLQINQNSWERIFKSLPPSKYPPKPDKSFELLKEWFFEILEIDKAAFLKTSMDSSPEILNTFEIELINKLINKVSKTYLPSPDAKREIAPPLLNGDEVISDNSKELIANKTFLKWLHERKEGLEKTQINPPTQNSGNSDLQYKNKIMLELIGAIGGHHNSKTIQPVYHYINDLLVSHNLTPLEAREIVLQMRGSVSPEWNKNVIPAIIEHLGLISFDKNKAEILLSKSDNDLQENDFLVSTIEDYIVEFKEDKSITATEYETLKSLLQGYFSKGEVNRLKKPVFVKNGNKKRLAYALGEIFKSQKNEALSFEYLELGKNNISIFKDEQIDKTKYNKSNLYKYYTTKP